LECEATLELIEDEDAPNTGSKLNEMPHVGLTSKATAANAQEASGNQPAQKNRATSVARPNQFDVKPNPENTASLFSAVNSDLKDHKIVKVCQSHNNRSMFFVITEDKTRAPTCHNIEIEAPPTMVEEVCETSFLDIDGPLPDRGQTIQRRETMKRKPSGRGIEKEKDKGDAFGFFSAFKFVKEIMASDSNTILKRNPGVPNKGKPSADAPDKDQSKDRIVTKIEEHKIAAEPKEELLNPLTASNRWRAGGHILNSLNIPQSRVGDDDHVEEVRESTFVPAIPGTNEDDSPDTVKLENGRGAPKGGPVNPNAFLGFDSGLNQPHQADHSQASEQN
jgi:hypothetical protein